MTKEFHVSMTYHEFKNFMQSKNFLEENIINPNKIITGVTWYKMSHFGESFDHHYNRHRIALSLRAKAAPS